MTPKRPKAKKARKKAVQRRSKALTFLVRLAESKSLQKRFERDPRKVMRIEGVSMPHQRVLLSGDVGRIQKTFSAARLPPNTTIKVTLIVIKF